MIISTQLNYLQFISFAAHNSYGVLELRVFCALQIWIYVSMNDTQSTRPWTTIYCWFTWLKCVDAIFNFVPWSSNRNLFHSLSSRFSYSFFYFFLFSYGVSFLWLFLSFFHVNLTFYHAWQLQIFYPPRGVSFILRNFFLPIIVASCSLTLPPFVADCSLTSERNALRSFSHRCGRPKPKI